MQRRDDFFKISEKLYGDASYAMALIRANPGFDYVGPGMVLRLPKEDPRITRQRKMKRREKLYGSQTTTQSQPDFSQYESMLGKMENPEQLMENDYETTLNQDIEDYDTRADLSGDEEAEDWLNDPAFEDEMAELFAETALRMGLDVDAMMEEWGVSGEKPEPQTQPPQSPTRPPQKPAGEEGYDPTEPDQSGMKYPKPGPPQQLDSDEEGSDDTSADVSGLPGGEAEGDEKGAPKVLKRPVVEEPTPTSEPEGQKGMAGIKPLIEEHGEEWVERKSLIEKDYVQLLNNGLPESGVFYPDGHFLNHSGFGDGYSEWEQGEEDYYYKGYYLLGKAGDDPSKMKMPSAAQYMSPRLITGNLELMFKTHNNLCGQLAVIAALGLDIGEGIEIFANINDHYKRIINDPEATTYANHLSKFIDSVGDDRFGAAYSVSGDDAIDTPEEFIEHLEAGDKVISLVNIDSSTSGKGKLKDEDKVIPGSKNTPHWVWVQEIILTKEDDNPLVRVYNPYMNREEVYDWNTFSAAYYSTAGNDKHNHSVVAPSSSQNN